MKFKRLPNGFGSITKLKDTKRRNPFVARKRDTTGKLVAVGYFNTYNEAFQALSDLNGKYYNKEQKMSLNAVFEAYKAEKYGTDLTAASLKKDRQAFNYINAYLDRAFSEISIYQWEELIKTTDIPRTTIKRVKELLNQMYGYAIRHAICENNVSTNIRWKMDNSTQKVRLVWSNLELLTLFTTKTRKKVHDMLTVMLYTGTRPEEICLLRTDNVHLDKHVMIGGIKTEAGTDRTIVIHPYIESIIALYVKNGTETLFNYSYTSLLRAFNKLPEFSNHELYDCRHTFITQCTLDGVAELAIKLNVGHSLSGNITLKVYTHVTDEWLVSEISKMKYVIKADPKTVLQITMNNI